MKKKKIEKKNIVSKAKVKRLGFFGKFLLSNKRDYILENLTLLADSGMGMLTALDSIADGSNSKSVKKVIEQIKSDIDAGSPLWQALAFSSIFPEKAISLIRIGEKSGRLTENLKIVSEQQEKERSLNMKIRGALMYPVFVLSVAVVVGIGISWFLLPKLALVFVQLRVKLPFITQIFINLGIFLGKYGQIVVPSALALFAILIYFIFFFKYTKVVGQYINFHLPIFKKIIIEMELARFGYLLGGLLDAGVPIVESIKSIKETASFYNYRKFYSFLEVSIDEGNSFQKSFSEYRGVKALIPSTILQMINAAEKSGHLSVVLKKIGNVYEEKVDDTAKNLAVILEPVLLVIVWIGVMVVALAVILPIYGLIGGLQQT